MIPKDPKASPRLQSDAAHWDYWALHRLVSSLDALRRSRPQLWVFSPKLWVFPQSCWSKYHQMGRRQSSSAQEFNPTDSRRL